MRLISTLFLFFLLYTISGRAQSVPLDSAEVVKPSKYLLSAKGPSGEVILTTGRIVKAIAISRPQSMEIARIYLHYIAKVKLKTDVTGLSLATVSFSSMKLSGDLVYKGFNIKDYIFPSRVTFRLILPGSSKEAGKLKEVLVTVKAANVINGNCTVSVPLHKKISEIPAIDKLAFYHSDDDYERAESQMKLIDRYFTAGWLIQRSEKLLDGMQYTYLHDPSTYLASNLEVMVINDWMTQQHFNRSLFFKKNDSLSLSRRMVIDRFRKKLIDQDFIKANVITNEDLLKACNLFAENLANYFDTSQPDFSRATYLSQMAESKLSSIGYLAIRDFADSYAAYHHHTMINWQMLVKASNMIRDAMTAEASKLTDHGQFTEAMGILNASGNYNLQSGNKRSLADSVLIGKLSQRLYSAYLDFALESLNFDIYSVTLDYYQKAMSLKQCNVNMIHPDVRDRYVADKICKAMLASAEKSLLGKDKETALATYENVVRIADAARLKSDYETARIHLEQLSNRPSGYRPWVGKDVAVVVPFQEIKNINERSMSAYKKSKLRERDSLAALAIAGQKVKTKTNFKIKDENADNGNPAKAVLTKSQLQDIKDSVFLSKIIKRLQANRIMKANSDSLVLSKLDKRIRINKAKNNKDSLTYLTSIKKNTIEKIKVQRSKDSLLLAANCKNFQAIQLRLSKMKGISNLALAGKQSFQTRKSEKMDDNAALRAVDQNENHLPAGKLANKKTMPIKMALQTELTTSGKRVEPVNIAEVKKQVNANIKNIHLRIWSGDTLKSAVMLNKTDSLQQLLILAGNRSLEPDVRALRLYYDETRCEQQKMDYMRELDQVRNLLKSNDYTIAARLLQQLISKSFSASCKVDKSEAIRLLASLEAPMIYKKWLDQLDSISRTEEPGKIMDAFEKARAYYKLNMSEKPGFAPPDFMSALKSRKETPFLLKAVSLMLDTNRPIYALDLMKEIRKMESKPDITLSLQKRLGEMLASGDYSNLKKSNDMLNAYNINEKWYEVLISAYKRQWKLFSK